MIASGSLQAALVKQTYTPIPLDALDVLRNCTVSASCVVLPAGKLDRGTYEGVDDCLSRIGGKWVKKSKGHEFGFDPTHLLAGLVQSGKQPEHNPSAYYPTPRIIVEELLDLANILPNDERELSILEPSAGTGGIANVIRERAPNAKIDCVEVLDLNVSALRANGHAVIQEDFLNFHPEKRYSKCITNPPFSIPGHKDVYIAHCLHAWSLLEEHGILVAVLPLGWTFGSSKAMKAFREWVYEYSTQPYFELGIGAFKGSGTMVNTCVIALRKDPEHVRRREINGWHCWHCWTLRLYDDNDRTSNKRLYELIRTDVDDEGYRKAIGGHIERVLTDLKVQVVLRPECMAELHEWYQNARREEQEWLAGQGVAGGATGQ